VNRDIDQIIDGLKKRIPAVEVRQHWVKNPLVDDDGIWWFYLSGVEKKTTC